MALRADVVVVVVYHSVQRLEYLPEPEQEKKRALLLEPREERVEKVLEEEREELVHPPHRRKDSY